MKTISYKNIATGLAEIFEVGSRGDKKRRADPVHYTCLNPEVIPKAPVPGKESTVPGKESTDKGDPKKPEKVA